MKTITYHFGKIDFVDNSHQSQLPPYQPFLSHLQGSRANSSENFQEKLDHRNHENNQIQRNSTILDSQNEIPPFQSDTNLTLPRRDQMRVINHES